MQRLELLNSVDEVGHAAFQKWGTKAQITKTIEELAELQVMLAKYLNGSPVDATAVVDEIADAFICVSQMRFFFGPRTVDERIAYKLNRTANAIMKKG